MPGAGSKQKCDASRRSGNGSALDSQFAEIQIRVALINRFNALGSAEIVRVA